MVWFLIHNIRLQWVEPSKFFLWASAQIVCFLMIISRREKSLESFRAEMTCMNRMRNEIIHLRALVSSQQDLIASLAASNESIRHDRLVMGECHLLSVTCQHLLLISWVTPNVVTFFSLYPEKQLLEYKLSSYHAMPSDGKWHYNILYGCEIFLCTGTWNCLDHHTHCITRVFLVELFVLSSSHLIVSGILLQMYVKSFKWCLLTKQHGRNWV